ncbi:MAG: diguanylate cyclase [Gemmatimonadota bacterium]|nr:MAG: diguanylate cyclase [Gemmatimonadota bacterium]
MPLEDRITDLLNLIRLHRLKSKIIAFSLLATLIPSLTMGWLSYQNNRRVLEEKITQELVNGTSQAVRDIDLWFGERQHELRVFASSYEISENLDRIQRGPAAFAEPARRRLQTYLSSVSQRIPSYGELAVVDPEGELMASSQVEPGEMELPDAWLDRTAEVGSVRGEAYWEERLGGWVVPVVVTVRDPESPALGGLLAKVRVSGVVEILRDAAGSGDRRLYLVAENGSLLASSTTAADSTPPTLKPSAARALFAAERRQVGYEGTAGAEVVGVLEKIKSADWGVVAEQDRELAFSQVRRLRNLTLLLVGSILVFVGLAAYTLGLTIVRPLDRLTHGAARIAAGDMDVDLPVRDAGELGYMTRAFNDMAGQVRDLVRELDRKNRALLKKNQELHELSIRDPLTGLYNHKHMMETLATESARALRYEHPFSVLMIDIDHFKDYNDQHGHQAGDRALLEVASTIRETLRVEDYAARYGGEEFLVMLPETSASAAAESAERIRRHIAERQPGAFDKAMAITVSIGVAAFPENGADPEEVLRQADNAMYRGKRAGRDRVVVARESSPSDAATESDSPRSKRAAKRRSRKS